MAITGYEILWRTAKKLMGSPGQNIATTGSVDSVTDTTLIRQFSNDYYNGGTIFVSSGNNALTSDEITDYVYTTGVFSLRTTRAQAYATGDQYTVFRSIYTRADLLAAVNEALLELGDVDLVYTNSSFVTVANQQAYSSPKAGYTIKKVEVATSTSEPYGYKPLYGWRPLVDSGTEKIVFDPGREPQDAGYLLRVTFADYPGEIDDDDDTINPWYEVDWLAWEAAKVAADWKMERERGQNRYTVAKLAQAEQKSLWYRNKYFNKQPRTPKTPHLGGWVSVK